MDKLIVYILAHKFNSLVYYVRINNDDSWDEIYNPKEATEFNSKSKALDWSKNNTNLTEYAVVLDRNKEIIKFDKWVKGGMIRRTFKNTNNNLSRKYNKESPEDVLKWWIDIRGKEDNLRYDDYKTWPQLFQLFKHIFSTKSFYMDIEEEKLVGSFQIFTSQNGKLKEFEKELNLILPYITYLDGDGNKILPVFDHYLSAGGNSVNFVINKDNKTYSVGGRYLIIKGTLKECFDYLCKERYYED